jgi:hypothetical protein
MLLLQNARAAKKATFMPGLGSAQAVTGDFSDAIDQEVSQVSPFSAGVTANQHRPSSALVLLEILR